MGNYMFTMITIMSAIVSAVGTEILGNVSVSLVTDNRIGMESITQQIERASGTASVSAGNAATTLRGNYMEFFANNPAVLVLVALVAIDIITGFIAGIKSKELSSSVSFGGMLKKTLIAFIVVTGFLIAQILPDFPIVYWVTILFIPTEIISILENIKKAGVQYPLILDVFAIRAKDLLEKKIIEVVTKAFEAIAESFAKGAGAAQAAQIDYDELADRIVKRQIQNQQATGQNQGQTTTTTTTTTGNNRYDHEREKDTANDHREY